MITGTLLEFKTGQPQKWHEVQAAVYAWLIGKNWRWDPASPQKGKLITENPDFQRIENGDGHRYIHSKAKRIFSVTQVCSLGGWQYSDKNAAAEGTWIHDAIFLIDHGGFYFKESDAPGVWPKIEAYLKFLYDYPRLDSRRFPDKALHEVPLSAKLGNKGTWIAGSFDKYIPGTQELEIKLLYLKKDGTYEINQVENKKINFYVNNFRHALAWLEFIK